MKCLLEVLFICQKIIKENTSRPFIEFVSREELNVNLLNQYYLVIIEYLDWRIINVKNFII